MAAEQKLFLGEFEQMVLLAVLRLGEEAYAVPIRRQIEQLALRKVSRGALYTTLERLEAKQCLESSMGGAAPERGGRSKRYYQVTSKGRQALQNSRTAMANLWQGLEEQI